MMACQLFVSAVIGWVDDVTMTTWGYLCFHGDLDGLSSIGSNRYPPPSLIVRESPALIFPFAALPSLLLLRFPLDNAMQTHVPPAMR